MFILWQNHTEDGFARISIIFSFNKEYHWFPVCQHLFKIVVFLFATMKIALTAQIKKILSKSCGSLSLQTSKDQICPEVKSHEHELKLTSSQEDSIPSEPEEELKARASYKRTCQIFISLSRFTPRRISFITTIVFYWTLSQSD